MKYSLSSSSKSPTRALWLCLWLSYSKTLESLILIAVSTSKNFNFICALLCVAKRSRALLKEDTRWRGSELQRKFGSAIKFDETETDTGACFPMHFVVSVSFYVSCLTQIDSNSKTAELLNNF